MKEIWKEIPDMQGYSVSTLGNVKSFLTDKVNGRILSKRYDTDGYFMVHTKYKGEAKVHRLVALTFLDNPNDYPVVNHKDGDKENNKLENLEWCTVAYNTKHGYDIGNSFSAISKGIEIYHGDKLLSVFNSTRTLCKYCKLGRGTIASHLSSGRLLFDELYLKEVKGNQKDHPLFEKPFIRKKLKRYQTQPIDYNGQYFESILDASKYLNIRYDMCQYHINNKIKYKGNYIEKISRYEYLRLKFND